MGFINRGFFRDLFNFFLLIIITLLISWGVVHVVSILLAYDAITS